jgi:hypothetical protein
MPWIIASQTDPDPRHRADDDRRAQRDQHHRAGPEGILISTYLSFFPVDRRHGEGPALAGGHASRPDEAPTIRQPFGRILEAARGRPLSRILFTSMKVAIAASLVGAIVGELPTGAVAGLRLAAARRLLLQPDGRHDGLVCSRFGARGADGLRGRHRVAASSTA